MKKHYELWLFDSSNIRLKLCVWYDNNVLPKDVAQFNSMEEAELRFSAMGFEKGEQAYDSYHGTVIKGVLRWDVTPCS